MFRRTGHVTEFGVVRHRRLHRKDGHRREHAHGSTLGRAEGSSRQDPETRVLVDPRLRRPRDRRDVCHLQNGPGCSQRERDRAIEDRGTSRRNRADPLPRGRRATRRGGSPPSRAKAREPGRARRRNRARLQQLAHGYPGQRDAPGGPSFRRRPVAGCRATPNHERRQSRCRVDHSDAGLLRQSRALEDRALPARRRGRSSDPTGQLDFEESAVGTTDRACAR